MGDGRFPRVCILTETYTPVVGGGERQAQSLAADLLADGFGVCVVTRRSDRTLARKEVIDDVPVYRVRPAGVGRSKRWLMVLSSAVALARLRHQYDVIFVSGFKALGISGVVISRLFHKLCILKADSNGEMSGEFFADGLETVGLTPASRLFRLLLSVRNWILRRADWFVAITPGIAEELMRQGVGRHAIHDITNAVDTTRFCPAASNARPSLRRRLGVPKKKIIVAYTGRLVTYKGLPLLVRVAERLQRECEDVGFVLIGSGGLDIHNCEGELRAYVSAKRLGTSIHFAGEVPNVHEYLQASDIFVLPTEEDAFPLALVEAMACGLPVISTPVGGIGQIITNGENGLLVKPGDFQELYDALRDLTTNPSRSATLGAAAAQTVRARYSREIVARRYIELFEYAHRSALSRRLAYER